jgi:hypothetical protein
MTAPWWTGIAPAQAHVECGGSTHTVRWEAGKLKAVDHGDLDDEATLAVLAGEPLACIELVRSWQRRRNDPRVLTLGSRGPTDLLVAADDRRSRYAGGSGSRRVESELEDLLRLEGGLPDRLQAHVAATWERRLRTGHAMLQQTRPQLQAALHGRLLVTLRTWLGNPDLAIELTMIEVGLRPSFARTDHGIDARLPFAWLTEVWTRGLATVFGRLCLTARPLADDRWTLLTLGPDLEQTTEIIIETR